MISNFECQECGSSQITESDGFFVCQGCGLTIEDPVIQYNIGSFKTDKKGNSIQTHALLLNGTLIGNNSERKFKKSLINFTRLNKINRSLSFEEKDSARIIFKKLIAQSEMAINIELLMNSFNKIFPKIKKYSKSRNLHLFCTTIYYVVMTRQLKNISLKTLLGEQNIDQREFFICIKAVFNELPEIFKEKAETMDVMIGENISKVCDELYLSPEVRKIAFKIATRYGDRLGFKSRIIAASSLSIALRIVSEKNSISVLQISDCLEITASTVYSYIKRVKIEVLRKNYQKYLYNLQNPIQTIASIGSIQSKSKDLITEIIIEDKKPITSINTQIPVPIINFKSNNTKLKYRRTSEFITKNKAVFSRFVPNSIHLESFGYRSEENRLIILLKNFKLSNRKTNFTEFEFSPPIS